MVWMVNSFSESFTANIKIDSLNELSLFFWISDKSDAKLTVDFMMYISWGDLSLFTD